MLVVVVAKVDVVVGLGGAAVVEVVDVDVVVVESGGPSTNDAF